MPLPHLVRLLLITPRCVAPNRLFSSARRLPKHSQFARSKSEGVLWSGQPRILAASVGLNLQSPRRTMQGANRQRALVWHEQLIRWRF